MRRGQVADRHQEFAGDFTSGELECLAEALHPLFPAQGVLRPQPGGEPAVAVAHAANHLRIEDRRVGANLRCDVTEFVHEPLGELLSRKARQLAIRFRGQLHQTLVPLAIVGVRRVVKAVAGDGPDFVEQPEACGVREVQVQEHEVNRLAAQIFARLSTGICMQQPILGKMEADDLMHALLVVDKQYPLAGELLVVGHIVRRWTRR